MKVVAVIPARFGSRRLPGKPLLDIGGMPLVVRVWRRCLDIRGVTRVLVATDHQGVLETVKKAGGEAVLTSPSHPSGTDRVAEAVRGEEYDLVVNIQGDEPFLEPAMIEDLIRTFRDPPPPEAATLACRISESDQLFDPAVVKVLIGCRGEAVYFSRFPVPFRQDMWKQKGREWSGRKGGRAMAGEHYRHLGFYAFTPDFLQLFTTLSPTPGEGAEQLEQLRILEHGRRIRVVITEYESHGVDTSDDLERARRKASSEDGMPQNPPDRVR